MRRKKTTSGKITSLLLTFAMAVTMFSALPGAAGAAETVIIIAPQANTTRAEAAAMFTRFLQNVLELPAPDETIPAEFPDVKPDDWFFFAVEYATRAGVMSGTGSGFAPNETLTRAMTATILWRISGAPDAENDERFADVAPDAWYSKAVIWAADSGIAAGKGGGLFGSGDAITREQLAVMLYRYAQHKGAVATDFGDLSGFDDADSVSAYALEAISWAVGAEIISGIPQEKKPEFDVKTDANLALPGGVTVIGDSVMLGAEAKMKTAFADLQFDAKVSRGMKAGMSILTEAVKKSTAKKNIVIALGTNYNYDAEEELEAFLQSLDGKGYRVVLVTPFCKNGSGNDKHTPPFSEFERGLTAVYPFVEIADWNALAGSDYSLLSGDKVHLNAAGKEEYTKLVMIALIAVQDKPAS
ncbi:MAG: S-layer homology domain-containing protein [Oscillospiraceae bacterium]|jgi:hypothetical protein|nr:S-layer homology domain-containing protein [Oscillospiraceae bacterium]